MSRLRVPVATLAGIFVLAVSTAILITEVQGDASPPTTASVALAAVAGVVALVGREHLAALVAADALLAGAALMSLFGIGAIFTIPLVPMLVATADASAARPEPRHLMRSTAAFGFAAGPGRQTAAIVRRARDGVVRQIIRPEPEEPNLRRSA
jgi:hypothetical protein